MDYLTRAYNGDYFEGSQASYVGFGSTAPRRGQGESTAAGRASRLLGGRRRVRIVAPQKVEAGQQQASTIEKEFKNLARDWRQATMMMSSPPEMAVHPSYQRIIALGAPVLPLVINELKTRGGHWFWALRFLANENPIPPEARGNVQEMKRFWLQWWDAKTAASS